MRLQACSLPVCSIADMVAEFNTMMLDAITELHQAGKSRVGPNEEWN